MQSKLKIRQIRKTRKVINFRGRNGGDKYWGIVTTFLIVFTPFPVYSLMWLCNELSEDCLDRSAIVALSLVLITGILYSIILNILIYNIL